MLTIAFKELRLFFKDKKALLLTFITPIGLITLLVFAFGGNSKETKLEQSHFLCTSIFAALLLLREQKFIDV